MTRQRAHINFAKGTLSTPITNSDTILSSADFASLPIVASGDEFIAISLDPDNKSAGPEIVYIVSHSSGSTSATVLREQEGTTAKAHEADTAWRHAVTADDFTSFSKIKVVGKVSTTDGLSLTNDISTTEPLLDASIETNQSSGSNVIVGQKIILQPVITGSANPSLRGLYLTSGSIGNTATTADSTALYLHWDALANSGNPKAHTTLLRGIYLHVGTGGYAETDDIVGIHIDIVSGLGGTTTNGVGLKITDMGSDVANPMAMQIADHPTQHMGPIAIGGASLTTQPAASAILDLQATDKALLLPRVTDDTAVTSPQDGMMIYETAGDNVKVRRDGAWEALYTGTSVSTLAMGVMVTDFVGTHTDGVTSSYAGFMAAKSSGSKHVIVPPGTWIIDSNPSPGGPISPAVAADGILLNVADQTWTLMPGAVIKQTNPARRIFTIKAANVCIQGGGTLDGIATSSVRSATSSGAIRIEKDSHNAIIQGITIKNSGLCGIWGEDSDNCIIRDCKILDSRDNGIYFQTNAQAVNDLTIRGNYINRSGIDPSVMSNSAIKIHGTKTAWASGKIYPTKSIYRVTITDNHAIMPLSPTANGTNTIEIWGGCPYAVISGNTTYGGAMGISVDASPYTTVSGNTIMKPSGGASGAGIGIELAGSAHCSIVGNIIDGDFLTGRGIAVYDDADSSADDRSHYCTISNNVIRNLSPTDILSADNPSVYAIKITTGPVTPTQIYLEGVVVSGNTIMTDFGDGTPSGLIFCQYVKGLIISSNMICGSTDGTAPFAGQGIRFDNCSQISINNNVFKNLATRAFGTTTSTPYVTVVGNVFMDTTALYNGTWTTFRFTANSGNVSGATTDVTL